MMTIALRFIPVLMDEADKIMKAQQARGSDFSSGNLLRRLYSLMPVLVPLFISAFGQYISEGQEPHPYNCAAVCQFVQDCRGPRSCDGSEMLPRWQRQDEAQ